MKSENYNVCPVERAGGLDNSIRRWLQNPKKILKPFIHEGMTVLDLGCGPGFFTFEIAGLMNGNGKVIAADLQPGMLEKVRSKIIKNGKIPNIVLHTCETVRIGVNEKVDFILAFYVIHEIPDHVKLFKELKGILKPGGRILIVEPNFHVRKKAFEQMRKTAEDTGFETCKYKKMVMSRTLILTSPKE